MENITVIIVEDELRGRETLSNLVTEYCSGVAVKGLAATVKEGLALLEEHSPDLVFLDIEMQNETGFDLLLQAEKLNFDVIFTTAFEHYALRAIKFSAIDYLLKPIDLDELQEAIDKVKLKKEVYVKNDRLNVLLNNIRNNEHRTITLSTSEGYEFILVEEILYCEANGSYTYFILKNKKRLLVSKHLKEYENLLSECNFMRVHQSFLINLGAVEKYVKADGGYIIMKNGDLVSISSPKKKLFIEAMSGR